MCGITGIIAQKENKVPLATVIKMTGALAHRGPDGEQCWQSPHGNVVLGHRRLAIIDLSEKGAQPMHYLNKYTIVNNGEIYNYKELRKQLEAKGYTFHSLTDTEVILAAYDCWHYDCVQHFDGMFAFAIWDEENQSLFAARDRFGEKPFFYHYDGNIFYFASEMKALWQAGIEKKINMALMYSYLSLGYVDNPSDGSETFYVHIDKLPAAHYLTFNTQLNQLDIVNYWDVDVTDVNKNISEKQAVETLQHLLTQSIRKRLRSDVPIGTSLSGGIDSSTILGMTVQVKELPYLPKAITATFPSYARDEWEFASIAASHFGVSPIPVTPTVNDFIDHWDKVCYHQEEPFGSTSIYAQYLVYQTARAHGIPVMLDGQGADETLAGYHKFYKWHWQELFLKRQLIASGEVKKAHKLGIQESFTVKNMAASLFPDLASVFLEQKYIAHSLKQYGLNKDFVKTYSHENYYTTPPIKNLNGALYFDTCMHGLEELLRYADRNAMAHGVEVRLPFLSHELVEFLFSLPSHFKINKGWTKWILRQSINHILPSSITWRKDKVAFEPPQQSWMKNKQIKEWATDATQFLAKEKILQTPIPTGLHTLNIWRYIQAAYFLQK